MVLRGGDLGLSLAARRKKTNTAMSGNAARPSTLRQPNATASAGANSEANTVPELPAPASPSAKPCYCGGYQ